MQQLDKTHVTHLLFKRLWIITAIPKPSREMWTPVTSKWCSVTLLLLIENIIIVGRLIILTNHMCRAVDGLQVCLCCLQV